MRNKVNVAFDITNTWEYELFRNLIHDFLVEDDFFEVYLITQSTDTVYVNRIATNMSINPANVFFETSDTAVKARLTSENIQLYLTNNNPLVEDVNNSNIPIPNTNTTIKCILVNNIPDRYRVQPLYITTLQFWLNEIRETNV